MPVSQRQPRWAALAVLIVATALTAVIGAYASIDAKDYYQSLTQPAWAPPASVFRPVWTVLYAVMCAAAWLVVRRLGTQGSRPAMLLYGTQLLLNAGWTWLFFHWHTGTLALGPSSKCSSCCCSLR